MITRNFTLYLNAGHAVPLVINVNQYDVGEQWVFSLINGNGVKYTPSTGAIVGIKSDGLGIINSGSVNADGDVVINETKQMTAAVGKNTYELLIDDQTHGTANFIVLVEPKPGDNADLSESDLSLIQQAIDGTSATAIAQGVGAWMDENLTPTTPVVDASLTVQGAAADSKATGDALNAKVEMNPVTNLNHYWRLKTNDPSQVTIIPDKGEIDDLKSQIEQIEEEIESGTGSGLTNDIKSALMNCFRYVAWKDNDPNAQTYIDALEDALYPPANLVSITAVYTQSGTVYNTDSLDSLKSDLVVTANMSDSTTQTVTTYALSGILAVGTSTITVTYGGKTTTFSVIVSGSSGTESWEDGAQYVYEPVYNTYVDKDTGEEVKYNTWNSSPYLNCEGAEKLTFTVNRKTSVIGTTNGKYNAFYDSAHTFIRSFETRSLSGTDEGTTLDIAVPQNAVYFRVSGKEDAYDTHATGGQCIFITPHESAE